MDVTKLVKPYAFEETGVGCEAHGDVSCLCDVVIDKPVEIKHSLGEHGNTILFSRTVAEHINVRDDLAAHMALVLGLYDGAAKTFRGTAILDTAAATVAQDDYREWHGDHRQFHATPYQEEWMRRNIPIGQAAFIVDQSPETVRQWRKANGVKIDLGLSDFQRSNATPSRKNLRSPRKGQFKINQNDPAVRAILEDRTLTIIEAGERLGVDKGVVYRARKALGIASLPKSGKRGTVDWNHPDTITILDGGMTEREAAAALGCSPSQVHRKRSARDMLSNQ